MGTGSFRIIAGGTLAAMLAAFAVCLAA